MLWQWIKMHSVCEKAAILFLASTKFSVRTYSKSPLNQKCAFPIWRQPDCYGSIPQKPLKPMLDCNAKLKLFSLGDSLKDGRIWPYYIPSRTHLAFGIRCHRIFNLPNTVFFLHPCCLLHTYTLKQTHKLQKQKTCLIIYPIYAAPSVCKNHLSNEW